MITMITWKLMAIPPWGIAGNILTTLGFEKKIANFFALAGIIVQLIGLYGLIFIAN